MCVFVLCKCTLVKIKFISVDCLPVKGKGWKSCCDYHISMSNWSGIGRTRDNLLKWGQGNSAVSMFSSKPNNGTHFLWVWTESKCHQPRPTWSKPRCPVLAAVLAQDMMMYQSGLGHILKGMYTKLPVPFHPPLVDSWCHYTLTTDLTGWLWKGTLHL